jgi:hypothetical protein
MASIAMSDRSAVVVDGAQAAIATWLKVEVDSIDVGV